VGLSSWGFRSSRLSDAVLAAVEVEVEDEDEVYMRSRTVQRLSKEV